jgi:cytoskeleton protein RodZ
MDQQDIAIEPALPEIEEAAEFRAKPDGGKDPMGEAGWFLQREREARGESLEDVGDKIGVHPYHIEAIEFGDMTRMPARLEALEMISAYAQYLGFDPEPLMAHYLQFLPKPMVAPRDHHPASPAPLSSAKVIFFGKMPKLPHIKINYAKIPGGSGGLVASIAGALVLFMGTSWMLMPGSDPEPQQQIASAADQMPTASTGNDAAEVKVTEEPMPEEQVATTEPPAPPVEEPQQTAKTQQIDGDLDGLGAFIAEKVPGEPGASADVPQPEQQVAANTPSEPIDAQKTPEGTVYGATNESARLVLKARAPVWVRVEDGQGNVVMTQMLMKGDTYKVPDRKGLVVIARDGGLLSYVIDGQEKGILGTPGEILVGRSLDLSSFEG